MRRVGGLLGVVGLACTVTWVAGADLESGSGPVGGRSIGEEVDQALTPPPALLTDVTEAAGIHFVHDDGARGEKLLPETMGGGVAFFDYDRDGDQDLLFVDSGGWAVHSKARHAVKPAVVLYANDGSGRFEDVTEAAGLGVEAQIGGPTFYGQGVAVGDYDGDGWPDLYVTAVGPNRLLRNRQGTFEDVTGDAGAGGGDAWSTCAAFFDADRDGDLDLFVCNYLSWSPTVDRGMDRSVAFADGGEGLTYGRPQSYRGAHPLLFLNDRESGDHGTFTELAEEAGLHVTGRGGSADGAPLAKALAVAATDVDRDGLVDLVVTNDTVRNFLFRNLGPRDGVPRFEELGELFGLAYDHDGNATGAMGIDWGYLDGEEDLALLVGNFAHEHSSLYRAQGDPTFYADDAHHLGLAAPTRLPLTFGLVLFDYDLDGRLDMLQVNGHVESDIERIDPGQRHRQPAQLFWNTGEPGRGTLLEEVPEGSVGDLARPLVGRGAAYADVDGDGDLDLALTQAGGAPLLLRNDLLRAPGSPGRNPGGRSGRPEPHWLRVRLIDRPPNRDALGARVALTAGGATQRREVMPSRSYLSQVELPVTFGLGAAREIDELVVTWPDGARETFDVERVDRLVVLERGRGETELGVRFSPE